MPVPPIRRPSAIRATPVRTNPGQRQFERSLAECRSRISALHAQLDSCAPTGPSPVGQPSSDTTVLHPTDDKQSVEDRPGVDATLTAIGLAAQSLLGDVARTDGGHRARAIAGNDPVRLHGPSIMSGGDVRPLDR